MGEVFTSLNFLASVWLIFLFCRGTLNQSELTKGTFMLKKGLVALVCLTVMSAMWSWATTTYQLQTKLASSGGTITAAAPLLNQTVAGTVYTTSVDVANITVAPLPGYKIVGLTKNNVSLMNNHPVMANWSTNSHVIDFASADVATAKTKIQSLVATFKLISAGAPGAVAPTTWQMQLKNANAGGSIATDQSFS